MSELRQIAALYVETDGTYFGQPGVDPWDVRRNAKDYRGPHPVVAHPPCGPWGRMAQFCQQDPWCGPRAVDQVREFGGVLEHPAGSRLWLHPSCVMPRPGEPPDKHGGFTVAVNQVAWGHPAVKPTWLYIVGLPPGLRGLDLRTGGTPTHKLRNRTAGNLPQLSRPARSRTPTAFRDFLIGIARTARIETRECAQ